MTDEKTDAALERLLALAAGDRDVQAEIDRKAAEIAKMQEAGDMPIEKERAYFKLMKTEFLLLAGAACAACETGDTRGLLGVLQLLPGLRSLPNVAAHVDIIERKRAEAEKAAAELLKSKPAPKKATGPSPWSC